MTRQHGCIIESDCIVYIYRQSSDRLIHVLTPPTNLSRMFAKTDNMVNSSLETVVANASSKDLLKFLLGRDGVGSTCPMMREASEACLVTLIDSLAAPVIVQARIDLRVRTISHSRAV